MNAPDSSRRFKRFSGFNAITVCASLKCEQRVKNLLKQPSMPSNSQRLNSDKKTLHSNTKKKLAATNCGYVW
jgi:hypothetical protein